MRSFFAGHGARRKRDTDGQDARVTLSQKPQVERFNRLLDYLFPIKSQGDSASRPSTPAAARASHLQVAAHRPSLSHPPPPAQHPPLRRPHTAPAGMHVPHHNAANADGAAPLDIILHENPVVLRGTGVDIENGVVRGIVRLSLPEATDIKVIEIRCTGKSRVAVMLKEGTRSHPQTSHFYMKEMDLLEGDKSHPHTLKAGRHEFPFAFEIDARSAAASLVANFGMVTIDWRLRATAVRPSFSTNFIAVKDIAVIRSYGNEALEFQQTLEIENVWPEKLSYSVILPHKAWAAGDHISAILKFTPLTKGVKVVSVKMSLQEKVKTVWKALTYEDVRVVCSKKEALRRSDGFRRLSTGAATASPLDQTGGEALQRGGDRGAVAPTSFFRRVGSRVQSRENLLGLFRTRTGEDGGDPSTPPPPPPPPESAPGATGVLPPLGPIPGIATIAAITAGTALAARNSSASATPESPRSSEEDELEPGEVEMVIRMHIPQGATPSHSVAPIVVSHRVKWDVLISNLDGHYSELRCSLPVHLLAKEVLEETLAATNATRTALLGESHGIQVQEIVLPAYHDHTRDRVAIAELHDHALATNPLNGPSTPASPEEILADLPGTLSSSPYGPSSTLADQMGGDSNVPRVVSIPDASDRGRMGRMLGLNGPADATSSELYLSLGRRPDAVVTTPPAEIGSHPASQSSSRASSPEPSTSHSSGARGSRHHFSIRPFAVFSKSKAGGSGGTPPSGASQKNPSAWHRQTLSRSSSGPSAPSSPESHSPLPLPHPISRSSTSPARTSLALGEYYDAVPEYAFAARGFLGGGITPLSSFRGLPSYDQAQRSRTGSPQSSMQSTTVTSTMSATSAASQGSNASGGSGAGSRRRGSVRGSGRASIAPERQSPPLPPLPPSPTSSQLSSG